jgi:excisionase family DNA binding protein
MTNDATIPGWLTVAHAADLTGYNPQYIRRLLRAGDVTGQKMGRAWLVSRDSLLAHQARMQDAGRHKTRPRRYKTPRIQNTKLINDHIAAADRAIDALAAWRDALVAWRDQDQAVDPADFLAAYNRLAAAGLLEFAATPDLDALRETLTGQATGTGEELVSVSRRYSDWSSEQIRQVLKDRAYFDPVSGQRIEVDWRMDERLRMLLKERGE